mmetsp:Transcript_21143/g.49637  ORF Transcript_21143/g.49637 Transcript_21143/m.49637 type:complete len:147 (+) Transcript_21143:85-525(+)
MLCISVLAPELSVSSQALVPHELHAWIPHEVCLIPHEVCSQLGMQRSNAATRRKKEILKRRKAVRAVLVQRFLTDYNAVFIRIQKMPRDEFDSTKADSHAALAFIRLDRFNWVGSSCFYTDLHLIDDSGIANTSIDEYSGPAILHG